jgi:hypothetical protein
MRRAPLVAAVVAALAIFAPSAYAVTFGANLNRAADNTATCGDADTLFKFGGQPPNPAFDTCSVDFQDPTTGESVFPPAGLGTVTQVRVKVGANTAPMQVVVEEALRKDNPNDPGHPTYACCKAINVSQAFTPAANQTTTLPVNLPVRSDLAPDPTSGYYVDDHLALSVFARNVPIPGSVDQNASDGGWFPAWQNGQERAGAAGFSGLVVLFNADWQQASSAPGTGGSEGNQGFNFGRVKALRDGTARLPVNVPGPGLLGLVDDRAATGATVAVVTRAAAKKARVKPVKKTVTKAGTITLKIKPSKAGKRVLRRKHRLKVKVRISFTPAGGKTSANQTASVTLKLKRKKRRR